MRGRPDRKQIQKRRLAVGLPLVLEEAFAALPAMRQDQRIAVQHPLEIDSIIDLFSEPGDIGILGKVPCRRECAAEKECRVHRRNLAIPLARAIRYLHPVIKPAMLMEGSRGEELQSGSNALSCLVAWNPAMLGPDADSSETESRRR